MAALFLKSSRVNTAARPGVLQAHQRLCGVGPLGNQLSSRVAMRSPMHFVLHRGEKFFRRYSFNRAVAHWRNCVPRWLRTR